MALRSSGLFKCNNLGDAWYQRRHMGDGISHRLADPWQTHARQAFLILPARAPPFHASAGEQLSIVSV